MSRSGYMDDYDGEYSQIMSINWRGAVASAFRGKRGQAFLKEMLAALDALPEKRLIHGELQEGDQVCAIGAVGKARGIDMSNMDPEDSGRVADAFGIADAMARELVFYNDDAASKETPEERWVRMRAYVVKHIRQEE